MAYINGMEPLDVQRRTVGGVGAQALPIQRGDTMVSRGSDERRRIMAFVV